MHRSKDPNNPTDLLGRSIEVGDFVAFPTLSGRSAVTTVGRIDKINFKAKVPGKYNTWMDVGQGSAEKYTVRIQPMVSTGYYWSGESTGEPPRPVTIQKVENIVKLDVDDVEDALAERNREIKAKRDRRAAERALEVGQPVSHRAGWHA